MRPSPLLALVLLLASCSDAPLPPLPDEPARTLGLAEGRPASVYVPSDYDDTVSYPLVVMLHGFMVNGAAQDLVVFQTSRFTTDEQIILVIPDGTEGARGRYWDATQSCCRFNEAEVDDEAYLRGLIAEAQANYRIDEDRVYMLGHSNGGYMSYHMACHASDVVTAIVSLAGATYLDPADCPAEQPVSVLQIHGTQDATIEYEGADVSVVAPEGASAGTGYPGAVETVERFATRAGCDLTAASPGPLLDLESSVDGPETSTLEYREGCARGVDMALWTMDGAGHIPALDTTVFNREVLTWLKRHRRR